MLSRMLQVLDRRVDVEEHRLFVRTVRKIGGDGFADLLLVVDQQADGTIDPIDSDFRRWRGIAPVGRTLRREDLLESLDGSSIALIASMPVSTRPM
jgi:hypothetical protein